ncbi:hypothetical protein NBG84_37005 [Streptomyces sp. CWNU-1]|uniref:Lipoprotein CseA n=1 Tax=Streptomyces albipurpureus TaxID=2897419 RepID=A0ABT0V1Q3_9ACTN|nr:hypothetical protein [Streptomyces sp. CWNU-1]
MRGLKTGEHPESGRGGGRRAAGGTAAAALAAFGMFMTSCSAGGTGVQDEGSAHADSAKSLPSSSAPAGYKKGTAVNPVLLIKGDPKVSKRVKSDLKPCGNDYPVDTSYGSITGGTSPDVVVNVMSCVDSVGVGTYVYRMSGAKYENVFMAEEPAVVSAIDRGDLVVTKQVWTENDPAEEPSAEEVTTYHWTSGKFVQLHWVRNEYSGPVDGDGLLATEPPDTSRGN